jgi:hypothetical protein
MLVLDSLRLTYFNIRQLINDDGRANIYTNTILVSLNRQIIVFNWISTKAREKERCYLSLPCPNYFFSFALLASIVD